MELSTETTDLKLGSKNILYPEKDDDIEVLPNFDKIADDLICDCRDDDEVAGGLAAP